MASADVWVKMHPAFFVAALATTGGAPSALHRSRVLHRLRGGGGAPTLQAPPVFDKEAAPAALQLRLAQPEEADNLIKLPASAFESLGLKPGDAVRVRKMKKAAFWSSVPDQAIGMAASEPELEAGVRVTAADMKMLQLQIGDDVLVAPAALPSSPRQVDGNSSAAAATNQVGSDQFQRYLQQRRRHQWVRTAMWMMWGRPHYGYGYGYGHGRGYGYGRSYGSSRGRSYYGGRSAYGRGRRVGGRMGGGSRRRR